LKLLELTWRLLGNIVDYQEITRDNWRLLVLKFIRDVPLVASTGEWAK